MVVGAILIVFYRYYQVRQPNDCDTKLVTAFTFRKIKHVTYERIN